MSALLWCLAAATPAAADLSLDGLPDPTRPVGAGGYGGSSGGEGLTTIRIAGRERIAIINGRTLRIGDRYGESVIADIRPYEVILERAGRRSTLRLVPKLDKQGGLEARRDEP